MFYVLPLDLTQTHNSPFSFLSVVCSLPFPKCPSSIIHLAYSYSSFELCSNVAAFTNSAKPSFSGGSDGKESACHAGDLSLIPGLGRSPGEGNGHPLQYSCLENSINRGAWWGTVHWVAKSQTRLKRLSSSSRPVETKLFCIQKCQSLSHARPFVTPPGSSVHLILQARILEWVAIPFSRGSSRPRDQTQVSCMAGRFFIT